MAGVASSDEGLAVTIPVATLEYGTARAEFTPSAGFASAEFVPAAAAVDVWPVLIPGPTGPAGAPGAPGAPGEDAIPVDMPDLTLIFENQLI